MSGRAKIAQLCSHVISHSHSPSSLRLHCGFNNGRKFLEKFGNYCPTKHKGCEKKWKPQDESSV